jgi:hypothetical protein
VVSGIDAALSRGGQFTGQVTAEDGGAPLEGVYVMAYNSQGSWLGQGSTNASGLYTTSGLPAGTYRLEFDPEYSTAQDYLGEYYNDKSTLAAADPVELTVPGLTVVNAVLARGGAISGTVTSSLMGAPLEGVTVTILEDSGNEVTRTNTDANGLYLARGLPTGVYHVHFILSYCPWLNYEIYYNQKPDLNAADNVSVTAPVVTLNINAQLPVPGTVTPSCCYLPLTER